jgi:hypothetical protein
MLQCRNTKKPLQEAVIGDGLWRVGFHVHAIAAITRLSGLVDIQETLWLGDQEALVFLVKSKDKSGSLFRDGGLQGCPVNGYYPTKQGLVVDWPGGQKFGRGGN